MPFDEVGLPGFQFIQDPIEYGTHSHHTNMDVYDRLQAEDLMKNAVIVASFVYHAANRDSLLPRKPLPQRAHERARSEAVRMPGRWRSWAVSSKLGKLRWLPASPVSLDLGSIALKRSVSFAAALVAAVDRRLCSRGQ